MAMGQKSEPTFCGTLPAAEKKFVATVSAQSVDRHAQ
jgi:hypothetical protein